MTQVQRPVHVREGEVSEPFGELFLDLGRAEACCFLLRWRIGFEDVRLFPLILVFLLQGLQVVPFSGLSKNLVVGNQAGRIRTRDAPGRVRLYLTYVQKRKILVVQLFYSSSESLTRGATGRVLCWTK